jgi:hypothetical protein
MPLWKSSQDALNMICAPSASVTGVEITAGLGANHSWVPVHNGNTVLRCKGASLLSTGSAGLLAVHLCDDAVGIWYLADLKVGGQWLGDFDLVGDSTHGTTVALDAKLYIYPALNAVVSNTEKSV